MAQTKVAFRRLLAGKVGGDFATSNSCHHCWKKITLIGSRALAACGDADGPSAANHPLWASTCTARLLRRSDTSASGHGCVGTRHVRLGDAGSVGGYLCSGPSHCAGRGTTGLLAGTLGDRPLGIVG